MENAHAAHARPGQPPRGPGENGSQVPAGRRRQLTNRGTTMKKRSKRSLIYGAVVAGCAMGLVLPRQAWAAVSDEDFNALKQMVQELNDKVKKLEQVHDQDQQTHQQDQQKV